MISLVVYPTQRLDLVAAASELLRAELGGVANLAAALGCLVSPAWPPQYYDEAATR